MSIKLLKSLIFVLALIFIWNYFSEENLAQLESVVDRPSSMQIDSKNIIDQPIPVEVKDKEKPEIMSIQLQQEVRISEKLLSSEKKYYGVPAANNDVEPAITGVLLKIEFNGIYSTDVYDFSKIDPTFTEAGNRFDADLNSLRAAKKGKRIELSVQGQIFDARVESNVVTDRGNRYMEINLDPSSNMADMTVHFGRKVTKGKIYTPKGTYMFQHNGKAGFIMSMHDYLEMKGILDKTEITR